MNATIMSELFIAIANNKADSICEIFYKMSLDNQKLINEAINIVLIESIKVKNISMINSLLMIGADVNREIIGYLIKSIASD